MIKILLLGLSVLGTILIVSCNTLEPYTFDHEKCEFLRITNDGEVEYVDCKDVKASKLVSFDEDDVQAIKKCFRRRGKRK